MTRKQIDQSREVRLWIEQIIIPAFMVGTTILACDPEFRSNMALAIAGATKAIKKKFSKEKENES